MEGDQFSGDGRVLGGGSNFQSGIEEPQSSYFLHHSDGPGLVLVSHLLTGDNYPSWNRSLVIALSMNNKLGFVDGSIPKPVGNPDLLKSWMRNNNIVIAWLLNSLSKDISASVLYSETASEIWNDLREPFQQHNGPRIFQLRREMINLRQDQDSVSVYFTKRKAMWEEMNNFIPQCTCGKCTCGRMKNLSLYHQTEHVMTFLMGLSESFTHARGQVLLMDPIPSINKVFFLISQEEKQRLIGGRDSVYQESTNGMAMLIKSDSKMSNKTYKRERPFCRHCKTPGHTVDKCYKLHGFPPGYKPKITGQVNNTGVSTSRPTNNEKPTEISVSSLTADQCNQLIGMLTAQLSASTPSTSVEGINSASFTAGTCAVSNNNSVISSKSIWVLDSGVSRHICADRSLFGKMSKM